jgi:hypothetical protein
LRGAFFFAGTPIVPTLAAAGIAAPEMQIEEMQIERRSTASARAA